MQSPKFWISLRPCHVLVEIKVIGVQNLAFSNLVLFAGFVEIPESLGCLENVLTIEKEDKSTRKPWKSREKCWRFLGT